MSQSEFNVMYDEWLKGVNGQYKDEWLAAARKCIAFQQAFVRQQKGKQQV